MTLEARVDVRIDGFHLRAGLEATNDGAVVVVGPNGAGKTTLLRSIAGLRRIDAGSVVLDGRTLDDGGRVFVPPHRRDIALVAQAGHLFPHLRVRDNVAFGLRARGSSRRRARLEAEKILDDLGVADLADRRVTQLSGGQARLVALARATAVRPRLLLMDEPFAGLDTSARHRLRRALVASAASRPGIRILVSHEPVDALTLGTTIAVIDGGSVVQIGTADDLRRRPATRYVADLVGVNLFRGRLERDRIRLASGAELVVASPSDDGPVVAVIHPRAVALYREPPAGSPRNVFGGTVAHVDDEGARLRVDVAGPLPLVAEITPAAARDLGIVAGATVYASVKATEIDVHAD